MNKQEYSETEQKSAVIIVWIAIAILADIALISAIVYHYCNK
jgi:hypothetical protein